MNINALHKQLESLSKLRPTPGIIKREQDILNTIAKINASKSDRLKSERSLDGVLSSI